MYLICLCFFVRGNDPFNYNFIELHKYKTFFQFFSHIFSFFSNCKRNETFHFFWSIFIITIVIINLHCQILNQYKSLNMSIKFITLQYCIQGNTINIEIFTPFYFRPFALVGSWPIENWASSYIPIFL